MQERRSLNGLIEELGKTSKETQQATKSARLQIAYQNVDLIQSVDDFHKMMTGLEADAITFCCMLRAEKVDLGHIITSDQELSEMFNCLDLAPLEIDELMINLFIGAINTPERLLIALNAISLPVTRNVFVRTGFLLLERELAALKPEEMLRLEVSPDFQISSGFLSMTKAVADFQSSGASSYVRLKNMTHTAESDVSAPAARVSNVGLHAAPKTAPADGESELDNRPGASK